MHLNRTIHSAGIAFNNGDLSGVKATPYHHQLLILTYSANLVNDLCRKFGPVQSYQAICCRKVRDTTQESWVYTIWPYMANAPGTRNLTLRVNDRLRSSCLDRCRKGLAQLDLGLCRPRRQPSATGQRRPERRCGASRRCN